MEVVKKEVLEEKVGGKRSCKDERIQKEKVGKRRCS